METSQGQRLSLDERLTTVFRVCPENVDSKLRSLPVDVLNHLEEVRFRLSQPVQLCGTNMDVFLGAEGGVTDDPNAGLIVTREALSRIVQVVTQFSLYAVEEELRRGFVTMPGGHRVGIGGRVSLSETGGVKSIRNITSVNVRIAREYLGSADALKSQIYGHFDGRPYSTLIISPPQCGKTTLLRDLARQWSEGTVVPGGRGVKVSIVDERSEIAGSVEGEPQFRVGARTDVLDACPKADGMLMAIRSLSPTVVVTDEIGRQQDRDAILEATHAGVAVLATAHATTFDEWRARPFMGDLHTARCFQRYVLLSRRSGPGTIEQILDAAGNPLPWKPRQGPRRG